MTYTIFEYAKENADELMANHQINVQVLLAGEYFVKVAYFLFIVN
jgi:cytochrome c oxidase assembly protein Cox11